jgi:cytochrome c oxidase subunit 3
MTVATVKKHPWHLVSPSPWPAVGTVGAFALAIGAVATMHGATRWALAPGVLLLLLTMAGWWRDVVHEARIEQAHTDDVRRGLRVGMLLFIASEVMFFSAWFWAFFHASLGASPTVETWPPQGIVPLGTWDLPFLNTLILLSSGGTVTWAHHAIRHDQRGQAVAGIAVTVLLGAIFLSFQAYEYGHALFRFTDGIYPSTFYMATGFHGAHVFIGVCFLTVCLFRAAAGHFTPRQHVGFEAAAWYWHFVDVVWLFLFTFVYWWGNSGYAG